jgi:hypothetical protein
MAGGDGSTGDAARPTLQATFRAVPCGDVGLPTHPIGVAAEYESSIGSAAGSAETPVMKKRALAAVLWSATGWYVGAMIAWALNIGPVLPVVLAASAALFVAGDPRRIIWTNESDRS